MYLSLYIKYIFKYFILGLFNIFLFFGGYVSIVFAEDTEKCDACNDTPQLVQDYIDMMDILIEMLPVSDKKNPPATGLHRGTIFNFWNNATKSAQKNIIPPYIPLVDTVFIDINMSLEGGALQRDYEEISRITDKLAERVGDMVDSKEHTKIVPHKIREKLDKRLKKIGFLGLKKDNLGKYAFELDKKTYAVLANFLWRLNQLYQESYIRKWWRSYLKNVGKGFERTDKKSREDAKKEIINEKVSAMAQEVGMFLKLYLSKSQSDTKPVTDFFRYIDLDYISYVLYIWEVHDAYRCTVGLATDQCNKAWQDARKKMSYLKKKSGTDATKARNTFVSARGRLRGVFGIGTDKDKQAAKQRQKSLLHSYRGREVRDANVWRDHINFSKKITGSPMSSKSLSAGIRNVGKFSEEVGRAFVNYGKASLFYGGFGSMKSLSNKSLPNTSFNDQKTKTIEGKKAVLEALKDDIKERERFKQLYLRNKEKEGEWKEQIGQMKYAFYEILHLQSELETDNVFIDVRRVTQQFPALSAIIYKNIDLIGTKNEKKGLYHAMGKVCEQQCTNLDGKKCRAEK